MIFQKRDTIQLSDVLLGCRPGRIQSVGYMQVIPLLSELSDERFISPMEPSAQVCTSGYGTLSFHNSDKRVMIVPCHAGYVVKRAAQDHAMAHAGVVAGSNNRAFDTAMCIQQSQGGLIPRDAYQMLILPFALREQALAVRKEKSFQKLWQSISEFNRELGVTAHGQLDYFLNHFKKELDEFVAEFESLPGQVGAVILVDDQVVGVERAPSHKYWQDVWPALIRECYGSLAIRVAQQKQEREVPPVSRTRFPDGIQSLDDLEKLINSIQDEEEAQAKSTVRELLDESLQLAPEDTTAGLAVETVTSPRFTGQVIRSGKQIVYASLPTAQKWLEKHKWETAVPFEI